MLFPKHFSFCFYVPANRWYSKKNVDFFFFYGTGYRLYSDHEIKILDGTRSCVDNEIPASDEDWSVDCEHAHNSSSKWARPGDRLHCTFKCRAGLDPDRAYLFQLGSAHQKVAPGRARSTRLHCHLFCRAVLDPGRALSICGSVNVAYVSRARFTIEFSLVCMCTRSVETIEI